jgi:hypothetical protein
MMALQRPGYLALLRVLRVPDALECERLELLPMLQVALVDWCLATGAVKAEDTARVILALEPPLQRYAVAYEAKEAEHLTSRPIAPLTVLDYRFIIVARQYRPEGFFDLERDKHIKHLPHQPVTMLTCDMSAMLLRLLGRIEKTRELVCDKPANN